MFRRLMYFLVRLLAAAAFAALLAYLFMYTPRNNQALIAAERRQLVKISQQLGAAHGQLSAIDTAVTPQSYGSAQALSESYDKAAAAVPALNFAPPAKLLAFPWDSRAKNYNRQIGSLQCERALSAAGKTLRADKSYLNYQAEVWQALSALIEYAPAKKLADPSTAAEYQSAAASGIAAISQQLRGFSGYNDPRMTDLNNLVNQAAATAQHDSTADFINAVAIAQMSIIANRQNFTAAAQAGVSTKLNTEQSLLETCRSGL